MVDYYDGPTDESHIVEKPLWYHKRGLMQTASGYGSKLVTSKMLKVGKRLHRIYVVCYSNAGSAYIIRKGKREYLRYL